MRNFKEQQLKLSICHAKDEVHYVKNLIDELGKKLNLHIITDFSERVDDAFSHIFRLIRECEIKSKN
ncbi:MAG: hypothetical protein IPM57_03935 [Oligoflexia bacterium]|nr:hypothetical protein [Oligoflexia bacterium]